MSKTIAIIGGGIGGLATAHHLSRAGATNITVYEASDAVGGKARSQYPAAQGGKVYPGEHGFRFFPHFYRHLLETLRQIPTPEGTVWNRLVGPKVGAIVYNKSILEVARPVKIEPSLQFVRTTIEILERREISIREATIFAGRLLQFASSCEERRKLEYDNVAWWNFTGAADGLYSRDFENVVIRASQNLSAMRAATSSTATIGAITLQLLFTNVEGEHHDALLNSPTDEAWLAPWRAHLEAQGVVFRTGARLEAFDFDPLSGRIRSLRFAGSAAPVNADYYVAAIPLEQFVRVLNDDMKAFDNLLGGLPALAKEALGDMTGLQFFLKRPLPIAKGHLHYPGTPFALTSISQGQFWKPAPASRPTAPGELQDVMSAIISNWDTRGTEGKCASQYTNADDLAREVWRQLDDALPAGTLNDDDILATHLDTSVRLNPFENDAKLLIHPLGQYSRRPHAETGIENLFLAADFVRTFTDLATMEGADEAARRAARAILDRMGVGSGNWPEIHRLEEGKLFASAKDLDKLLFKAGLPHVMQPAADLTKALPIPTLSILEPEHVKLKGLQAFKKKLPSLDPENLTREMVEQWERFLRH